MAKRQYATNQDKMMFKPYVQAPHTGGQFGAAPSEAPNAALLIDFDNVTMGMRTDLAKELKSLLNSDVIKGKVTVQRAYADWRRYPQYIVPLSEASVDLIFAPAYGSNKKNATDIRMAIDGIELVFIRPEIGTFILLTGDSDFSSLVLKLKEYGKYVIGVGIQESSSDILVQNCDEYYSYTTLTGLRKTGEGGAPEGMDPWVLVERALAKMVEREDVMRSDRLKQVMVEINPGFHEKDYGFSKFSRFVTEASSRGLIQLHKEDNGQYRVAVGTQTAKGGSAKDRSEPRRSSSRSGRTGRSESRRDSGRRGTGGTTDAATNAQGEVGSSAATSTTGVSDHASVAEGWALLRRAVAELIEGGKDGARDSDVKRRMLAFDSGFDEAEYGFSKFSRFLRRADELKIVEIRKRDDGNFEVRPGTEPLPTAADAPAPGSDTTEVTTGAAPSRRTSRSASPSSGSTSVSRRSSTRLSTGSGSRASGSVNVGSTTSAVSASTTPAPEIDELELPPLSALGTRPKTRRGRGRGSDSPPLIFDGQVVSVVPQTPATPAMPATPTVSETPAPPATPTVSEIPAMPAGQAVPRTSATPASQAGSGTSVAGAETAQPEAAAVRTVDAAANSVTAPVVGATGASEGEPVGGEEKGPFDPNALGLPTDGAAAVRYLTNSYGGVGEKTAQALVSALGSDLFTVLHSDPDRIATIIPRARAERVLEGWRRDYERRSQGQ